MATPAKQAKQTGLDSADIHQETQGLLRCPGFTEQSLSVYVGDSSRDESSLPHPLINRNMRGAFKGTLKYNQAIFINVNDSNYILMLSVLHFTDSSQLSSIANMLSKYTGLTTISYWTVSSVLGKSL